MTTFISTKNKAYHLLERYINNTSPEELQQSIDEYIEEAIENNDFSFNTGLLGIGWFIVYIHQQKSMQEDIDDLLYDFDDLLYKIAIKEIVKTNKKEIDSLLEVISYFQQRAQCKVAKINFHRRFAIFEIMKLLSDKLTDTLIHNGLSQKEELKTLLRMSYLMVSCVNENKFEKAFYNKVEDLISTFQAKQIYLDEDLHDLYILAIVCVQFKNPHWVNEILSIINHHTRDFQSLFKEIFETLYKQETVVLNPASISKLLDKNHLHYILLNIHDLKIQSN